MKKVLSLVLVIAMVLSSMSFAFASTPTDIADSDYEKAINALVALDVVDGYEDGTYRPEKTITRAEMAKLLVEALGYGKLTEGAKSGFSDTQNHWADKWVAIASGTNLVVGYPDGTFKPDQVISYNEVLTMVIRALGYTDASLTGV
ncbi:MAG: S-layer homology domain-containing protein, partial [Tissierellia bacterium]|nr:S-layer homology domain-containing protein [Tissierellia bacterium]